MMGIYKITSPSNKVYIGSAVDIHVRWLRYKRYSCDSQPKIYKSLKKYGVTNHLFEVLEECEFEQLYERERYWQEYYDVLGKNGLNCCLVKTDEKPMLVSEETRIKISNLHKGKKLTKAQKEAVSNYMKNRVVKEETLEKQRKIHKRPNPKNGKKVISKITNEVFNSISELSKHLNIKCNTLFYKINNLENFEYQYLT